MYLFYKILDKDRNSLNTDTYEYPKRCFSTYNLSSKYYTGDGFLIILMESNEIKRLGEESINIPPKEVAKEHLDKLSKEGFPSHFIDLGDNGFNIELRESEYLNKCHIRIALDFIRMIIEPYNYKSIEAYYDISKTNPEILQESYFEVLQGLDFINNKSSRNTWHRLPGTNFSPRFQRKNSIIPTKKVLELLKTTNLDTHMIGSYELWKQVIGHGDLLNNYSKNIEFTYDSLKNIIDFFSWKGSQNDS